MTVGKVVCVLMLQGLLVTSYPTVDYIGADSSLVEFLVEELAQFAGSTPATGSVTLLEHSPCEQLVKVHNPPTITWESDHDITYLENDDTSASIYAENDESDRDYIIPKEVILGAILAETITANKGAEINATLSEIDAFVETELDKLEPLLESALAKADISEVDRCVDSALSEMESQIAAELDMIDDFIESELAKTEKIVESAIENANLVELNLETTECLNNSGDAHTETVNLAEKEALVDSELGMLELLVDSILANTESVIDFELDKVDALVESELAKVDTIVKAELDKVDIFVETELAKTDAFVKSELAKVESFVEAELARVEIPVEDEPVLFLDEIFYDDGAYETPYDDSVIEELYDDIVTEIPVVGEAMFSGVAPAAGSCKITRVFPYNLNPPKVGRADPSVATRPPVNTMQTGEPDPVISRMEILPSVNVLRHRMAADGDQNPAEAMIEGEYEFRGTTRAVGRTSLYAEFACPPLLPTQVGPDGKKYIWIAKPDAPPRHTKPRPSPPTPSFVSRYPADFPEAVIMDASKNYERLISEDLDVDFGILGGIVCGEVGFEGTAPAYGSVNIRG